MKCIVYIFFLLFFVGCTSLPNAKEGVLIEKSFYKLRADADPVEIKKTRNDNAYYQAEKDVSVSSVIEVLSKNEHTKQKISEAKYYYNLSKTAKYLGLGAFIYGLTLPISKGIDYYAASLVLQFIERNFDRITTEKLDPVIDIYNQSLTITKKETTSFRVAPTLQNDNLGLVMEYRFKQILSPFQFSYFSLHKIQVKCSKMLKL